MIRTLIVTDIRLYREGLAQMLGRAEQLAVVGAVARREDALGSIMQYAPDVVLLDLGIPDRAATINAMHSIAPQVPIVALAIADDEGDVLACAEAGVAGYVPRDASVEDVVAVLQCVVRGEALCSPRIAGMLIRRVAALSARLDAEPSLLRLTGREREIVHLLDQDLSNKQIALHLGIELATVKNHVHSILEKLKVHRRAEAAARLRAPLRLPSPGMATRRPQQT